MILVLPPAFRWVYCDDEWKDNKRGWQKRSFGSRSVGKGMPPHPNRAKISWAMNRLPREPKVYNPFQKYYQPTPSDPSSITVKKESLDRASGETDDSKRGSSRGRIGIATLEVRYRIGMSADEFSRFLTGTLESYNSAEVSRVREVVCSARVYDDTTSKSARCPDYGDTTALKSWLRVGVIDYLDASSSC